MWLKYVHGKVKPWASCVRDGYVVCVFFACNVSAQLVQAYRVGGYGPSVTAMTFFWVISSMTGNICVFFG